MEIGMSRFWIWLFGYRIIWMLLFILPAISIGRGIFEDLGFAISARAWQAKVLSKGVEREQVVLVGGTRPDSVEIQLVPWLMVTLSGVDGGRSVTCDVRGQRALWGNSYLRDVTEIDRRLDALAAAPLIVYADISRNKTICRMARSLNSGLALVWLTCIFVILGFLIATVIAIRRQFST